jgi:hypothetical protein
LQDPFRKIVFERKYLRKFSCSTFSGNPIDACKTLDKEYNPSEDVEKAAVQYARDNLALVKVSKVA